MGFIRKYKFCSFKGTKLFFGLGWRHPIIPLKHPRKGENIGIAHGQCRFAGGEAVAAQQLPGVLHAALQQVLLGGKAGALAEQGAEIGAVQPQLPGQTGDGNIHHVIAGQIGSGLLHIVVFRGLALAEQGKQLENAAAKV